MKTTEEKVWYLADQTEMHYATLVEAQKAVEAMESLRTYWEDFRPTLIGTEEECEGCAPRAPLQHRAHTRRICLIRVGLDRSPAQTRRPGRLTRSRVPGLSWSRTPTTSSDAFVRMT